MQHCSQRIGDAYFRTPRNSVTAFVNLLAVLEQNPDTSWQQLLEHVEVTPDTNPDLQPFDEEEDNNERAAVARQEMAADDDDLASFKL